MDQVDGVSSPLRYGESSSPAVSSAIPRTPLTPASSGGVRRGELQGHGGRRPGVQRPAGEPFSSDVGESTSVVWGTTVDIGEARNRFREFFLTFIDERTGHPKYPAILRELRLVSSPNIGLDCADLAEADYGLYQQLITYPQEIIPAFDTVVSELWDPSERDQTAMTIQVRPYNLKEHHQLRSLDPIDLDKIVSIRGMVIRVGPIVPDMTVAFFRCSVCHADTKVNVDRGQIQQPPRCGSCQTRNSLAPIHNRCEFADKQLIRVQEAPELIPDGETPQSVDVFAWNDLVDVVRPGDRVTITGIFRAVPVRFSAKKRTVRSVYRTYIDGIHFRRTEAGRLSVERSMSSDVAHQEEDDAIQEIIAEREAEVRALSQRPDIIDLLVASLAPSIYGHDDVKRGLLCQLFGGANKDFSQSGTGRFRGELNVLLCGDPGTAKSQLLQFVHAIAPRGIFTSGKGSSAVGLTAYVVRDPETREFVMESGALVLSDQGVCCIDEFDKMSATTRSILHEVMEQQTVSIAKAGIIATLNARTSILAAANPLHSRYDPSLSVVENIQLPPTLLSRFDLVYLILDRIGESHDRRLAAHIIGMYQETNGNEREVDDPSRLLSIPQLTSYISYARSKINPSISEEAAEALVTGYVRMRSLGQTANRQIITATPRQLDSLIRLSESLAKMRLSTIVTQEDVQEALRLMDVSTGQSATDPTTGIVDIDMFTTGISATARREIQEHGSKLESLLKALPAKAIRMGELMRRFNEQEGLELGSAEFKRVVDVLADMSTIRVTQRAAGDNCEIRYLG
ncbi:DNA replication licensing factor MCM4 [Plasmodiophora brassicae]|uniref:DNA replication licensing factor MCM4 n=1 Tax=Plasmodiophora brassicae TaxID=37360 RepID=A0A0G4IMK8_PLABS|nr:hypothetical protein PBRA_005011 [Plasmodiophora brassicae]SPQ99278.1 unnamed protein product [Plasmodiophora brassicae]